jgi:hypothetical protein
MTISQSMISSPLLTRICCRSGVCNGGIHFTVTEPQFGAASGKDDLGAFVRPTVTDPFQNTTFILLGACYLWLLNLERHGHSQDLSYIRYCIPGESCLFFRSLYLYKLIQPAFLNSKIFYSTYIPIFGFGQSEYKRMKCSALSLT